MAASASLSEFARLVLLGDAESLSAALRDIPPPVTLSDFVSCVLNQRDQFGNMPLHLAAWLGRTDLILLLLAAGAAVNFVNSSNWSPLTETLATGNFEGACACFEAMALRGFRMYEQTLPALCQTMEDAPDFELTLDWSLSSWIPFVTRFCPSDTYRIVKRGACIRADVTLIGFEGTTAIRGNRSFVFAPSLPEDIPRRVAKRGSAKPHHSLYVLDHDQRVFMLASRKPSSDRERVAAMAREGMSEPIEMGDVPVNDMVFTPRSTWLGYEVWEDVGPMRCRIFDVTGVKVTSVKRSEHISKEMRAALAQRERLESEFEANPELGKDPDWMARWNAATTRETQAMDSYEPLPAGQETLDFYLGGGSLYTREMRCSTSNRSFSASVAMCADFPLTVDVLLPLLELISPEKSTLDELRQFLTVKLPVDHGFPVKIELPLYKVATATAHFASYSSDLSGVSEDHFAIPEGYTRVRKILRQAAPAAGAAGAAGAN
eukprot:c25480_g1_i1.p2 GENE.c25480_g1_i1~~c25480_g1_i1.p2  ORF type:complete len:490 (-),score=77.23 c25480_g1_i1:168-1637(-)